MGTTTRLYLSTDSGAPTLNGTVGSLNALLKACLYGNGSGVAYGSGGSAKAAAGWSIEFEDAVTHKLVLRNSSSLGSGCYLRLLDDGTGTSASAAQAHMNVFSSMSDIDTGTDSTPASVTGWPGARIEKSTAANSTAVPWVVVADERTVYFSTMVTSNGYGIIYGAGDYTSYIPGFAYAMFCAGGRANTSAASRASPLMFTSAVGVAYGSDGIILMRDYTSAVGSVLRQINIRATASNNLVGNSDFPAASSYLANAMVSCPVLVNTPSLGLIGHLRGLKAPLRNVNGETMPGLLASDESGSSLILLRQCSSFSTTGATFNGGMLIETALPWL